MRAIALLPLLAACAPAGPWPSLALRPAETPRRLTASVPDPAPPAADPAAVRAAAAALDSAAAALVRRERDLASALRAARGAPPGSDAWSLAQVAISQHDSAAAAVSEARAQAEAAPPGRADPGLAAIIARANALESAAAQRSARAQAALGG